MPLHAAVNNGNQLKYRTDLGRCHCTSATERLPSRLLVRW
jgi:hypothetical protein